MAAKPTVLITGVAGTLGLRLLRELPGHQVIGVDVREPAMRAGLFHFRKIDLAEERSCDQLLELTRAYRPEAVAHLAFVMDPVHSGVRDRKSMWLINVLGSSRVSEAIAEHNRMVGGIEKFIFPSSAAVYGPRPSHPVTEDTALNAHGLLYAIHQQEADSTIQVRAAGLRRCQTYVLRSHFYGGPGVRNYALSWLRGVPDGTGRLGARLRRRGARLPALLPARGNHLENRLQFVHVEDMARLVAHIIQRKEADPQLTLLNVAGRGDPLSLRRCFAIAGVPTKTVPAAVLCRQAQWLRWRLGISGIPPAALPYLLGSSALDTVRLRIFLGEHYRTVMQHTSEDALLAAFREQQPEKESDPLMAVDA
ncbi:MAG TPA: NAD-dependent epimerase/dehydratase family protein [Candidatus Angelobacter sp.]|nr:NAD-dependent epimerase/dehydratase family protein [Candidatus Angelobacter sp.]